VSATPDQPSLLRAVSRWQVVSLSANDVIGSGVYLLPAAAAAAMGTASVWAVLAAGLLVLMLVLCFAEAGSMFDRPGGAYVYTREAFGDFVGFEVGWMTWVARVTAGASLSAGVAQQMTAVWSGAASGPGRVVTITAALAVLTLINVAGVRYGARTAVFLIVSKLLPLLLLIAVGLFAIDWDRVFPIEMSGEGDFGKAALLILFAYAGFENTAAPASEFKNPRRDVPFALIVMIIGVTALYTLVQLVGLGVVPGLASSETPMADAAGILLGRSGLWLLTVGGVLSILGTANNTVLSGARYLFALSERGQLPRFFAGVHPRFRTPWVSLVTLAGISLPLALTGTFTDLAALSIIARMATYIGTAAAIPVLRRKLPATDHTIRLPGGPAIPIAALIVCIFFLFRAEAQNLKAGAIALAVGALIYMLGRRNATSF
jgi:basic amino acid/polyamine antiporter, APA family